MNNKRMITAAAAAGLTALCTIPLFAKTKHWMINRSANCWSFYYHGPESYDVMYDTYCSVKGREWFKQSNTWYYYNFTGVKYNVQGTWHYVRTAYTGGPLDTSVLTNHEVVYDSLLPGSATTAMPYSGKTPVPNNLLPDSSGGELE